MLKIDNEIEVANKLVKNEIARKKIAEEITISVINMNNKNLELDEIEKVFRQWGTSTMIFIEVSKKERGEVNQLKQIRLTRNFLAKEICLKH